MASAFVAYYRVSTKRQGQSGLGLEAQRAAVLAHLGRAPDHEFTEVESGKRSDRPELLKALDLAELTGATLIVAKLDRLSRNAAFLLTLRDCSKVPIVFADMPKADRFVIGVMAMIAEWEREQIGKRTKEALAAAKARGTVLGGDRGNLGGVRALGTSRSAAKRSETAKARAAKVLPHIEAAKAQGHRSTRAIAAYLNRKGIRTARGADWRSGSVGRLLASASVELPATQGSPQSRASDNAPELLPA
jgi:DNA invertase Pin-like site-specific DNA recombinase